MIEVIVADMLTLVSWAKSYEEGDQKVSDSTYDAYVRYLVRLRDENPLVWEEALERVPCFKDGSWTYTGMFYMDEDEAV